MKHSKSLLEQLAIFKDLPVDEQRRLLEEVKDDEHLSRVLESYKEQDSLLGQLSRPKPDPGIRSEFYTSVEKRTGRQPSFFAGLSRMAAVGGRIAFAIVGVALLVAVAMIFRGQLLVATGPEQGAIGRQGPTATPTPADEGDGPVLMPSELRVTLEGEAPVAATFAPYPASESLPTPTALPYPYPGVGAENGDMEKQEAAPVLGPAYLRLDEWSENGQFLALWRYEAEDYENNPQYPAGTLSFYEPQSGQICIYPRALYDGDGTFSSRHAWLNAARLLVFNEDGTYGLGTACTTELEQSSGSSPEVIESILAQNRSRDALLALGENGYYLVKVDENSVQFASLEGLSSTPFDAAAFSPDERLVAINSSAGGTTIVDASGGDVVQTFAWQSQGGLGSIFAPQWLDEQTVLVRSSAEQGALLLTIDGNVEPVGSSLFDYDVSPALVSEGVMLPDGTYAIVGYYMPGSDQHREGVWYYASSGQTLQTLSFDRAAFTPNGARLLLFNESDGQQGAQNEVWWASTDSPSLSAELLYQGAEFPYTTFADNDPAIAVVARNQLIMLDNAGDVATYTLPEVTYGGVPVLSTDGTYVASVGGYSGRPDNLLYAIPVR